MIGYVLLIVIAIGMSIAVYAYLKNYLPREKAECQQDVSLTIEGVNCVNGNVEITLRNRGLFSINGAYIRIGDEGRIVKEILNENFRFTGPGGLRELEPGEEIIQAYVYEPIGEKEIDVVPIIFKENEAVLCENAVISQNVVCS